MLSIIVPALDEAQGIAASLERLAPLRARGAEVIVVDGGSNDGTAAIAASLADQVIVTAPGRARQMNAGAATAGGEWLLFLHADTHLPESADSLITEALRTHAWGRFDVRIAGRHPMLRVVAALMNRRSRWSGIATGDQAMFVRRDVFMGAGGFPGIALMEDIALSGKLKAVSSPACISAKVTTSGRRWEQNGVWRTILLMAWLRWSYFCGADPAWLAILYRRERQPVDACRILVFARAPVPGETKTRLIPALGAEGAARLHRRLVERMLSEAVAADLGPVTLCCAPDAKHPFFAECAQHFGVTLQAQSGDDLGSRMHHALEQALQSSRRVLLVGSDIPALGATHLKTACAALDAADAVFIPAEDGGYVLVGLTRAHPHLFEGIAWGGSEVMAQTRARAGTQGLRLIELDPLWDLDRPADLARVDASLLTGLEAP